MGNRAIIQTRESFENEGLGVYLHWNGGRDSVEAFLKYCELKGYRPPSEDNYGWARLCQVIGNFFGGTLSIGIDNFSKNVGKWQDNGTYIIDGWKIVGRECWNDSYGEQNEYDLNEMLLAIDSKMPADEQLGEKFITSKEIPINEVKVGDTVYIRQCDDKFIERKVIGFGNDEVICGYNVKGLPLVALYADNQDHYRWNINNYIREEIVRIAG